METRFIPADAIAAAVPAPAPLAAPNVPAPVPSAAAGGAFQRLSAALGGAGSGTSLKRGRKAGAWTPANKGRSEKLPRADPIQGARTAPPAGTLPQTVKSALTSSICNLTLYLMHASLNSIHS
jgi:hypothetical protein